MASSDSFIIDMPRQAMDQKSHASQDFDYRFLNQAQELFLAGLFWQTFYLPESQRYQG